LGITGPREDDEVDSSVRGENSRYESGDTSLSIGLEKWYVIRGDFGWRAQSNCGTSKCPQYLVRPLPQRRDC
jgi:hypothetical protein